MFSFGSVEKVRGLMGSAPSCREPPERSNMEASGRPCVALVASLRPVFVLGLSDYSYIPKDVKLNSPRPEAPRT